MLRLFVSRFAMGNNTCIYYNYLKTIIESIENKINSFCIDCFKLEKQSYSKKWKSKLGLRFNSAILREASWLELESTCSAFLKMNMTNSYIIRNKDFIHHNVCLTVLLSTS